MNVPTQTIGLKVYRVPCLDDNYTWLIHEPTENKVRAHPAMCNFFHTNFGHFH